MSTHKMKVLAAIPARYGSERFPGKLLHKLQGKSILRRVIEQVQKSNLINGIIVIADDDRLISEASRCGVNTHKSVAQFICGSDRILHAPLSFENYDLILNIQADQPLLPIEVVDQLIDLNQKQNGLMISSVRSETPCLEQANSIVKVEVNRRDEALNFYRNLPDDKNVYYHFGLYGFRPLVIPKLRILEPSESELQLSLEQLRWMNNGFKIHMCSVPYIPKSINTANDLSMISL